jgi:DNA-directed RNA polymerase subunit M/transcription elongation factor TFIIS
MAARGRVRPTTTTTVVAPETSMSDRELWVRNRADQILRKQYFYYELEQGIVTPSEIGSYTGFDASRRTEIEKHTEAQIILHEDEPGFKDALETAIRNKDYNFDFETWDSAFRSDLERFQDYEVVFFRNRTTAFTLDKPCPNCGQKKLVSEGAVFTRSADEAASRFATCKNCSSRFRL